MSRRVFLVSVTTCLILVGLVSELRDIQPRRSLPAFLFNVERLKAVSLSNPFGYAIARHGSYLHDPYVAGWDTIEQALPEALSAELTASGFNAIRLVVDPAPLLFLDDENFARLLTKIVEAAAYILRMNLKCIVDIHPSLDPSVPGYAAYDLLDGPGNKFHALISVEARLAATLQKRFSPETVALELFNEPPRVGHLFAARKWRAHLALIYRAVRDAAPNLTLIMSGDDYGGLDGLMALDPTLYDSNTIYSFHDYHPMVFTHQAVQASVVGFGIRYVRGLKFPPAPVQQLDIQDEARAAIASDQTQTSADRSKVQKKLSGVLDAYFDVPQDEIWIRRRVLAGFRWAIRNGVSPSRVFWGEFGVWTDIGTGAGADRSSRAAYLAAVRRLAESFGFGWGVWELTNPTTAWRIVTQTEGQRHLDPEVRAALFE